MARKRTIDPDLWTDEKVLDLPWGAVAFFIGLISFSDDEGRLAWVPRQLTARIAGGRPDVTLKDVKGWMDAIEAAGLVQTYTIDGHVYATHPQWRRHQYVNKKQDSRIPPPPETQSSRTNNGTVTESSDTPPVLGTPKKVPSVSESVSESVSGNSESKDSAAGTEGEPYVPEPCPASLPSSLPAQVDALKRVAVVFLGAFANAKNDAAVRKYGPAYVDALATFRSRGIPTAEVWRCFGEARIAHGGRPLFGGQAKTAISYLSPPSRSGPPQKPMTGALEIARAQDARLDT